MPFAIIPLVLLVVPVMEIAVFIAVGSRIGVGWTLALILFTAVLGTILLRAQGLAVLDRIRRELEADRLPGKELVHGALILVAGILLLTPGFVTDTIGFALFVPALRSALWRRLAGPLASAAVGRAAKARRHGQRVRIVDLGPEEFSEPGGDRGGGPNGKRGTDL